MDCGTGPELHGVIHWLASLVRSSSSGFRNYCETKKVDHGQFRRVCSYLSRAGGRLAGKHRDHLADGGFSRYLRSSWRSNWRMDSAE